MPRKTTFFFVAAMYCVTAFNCNWKKNELPAIDIPDLLPFTSSSSQYWQVGYSADTVLNLAQFRPCNYAETAVPTAIWHPSTTVAYPYTGQNRDSKLSIHSSGRWALRPHEIAMEASNTGQYSMLLFIPPANGNYKIKVVFEGVHIGLSSTDVHVLLNNTPLFTDFIDGYGGDTTFNAVAGNRPSVTYSSILTLKKSDTIVFAVGYGANKTFFNDTTGLMIEMEME